jgi:hypothetical protein
LILSSSSSNLSGSIHCLKSSAFGESWSPFASFSSFTVQLYATMASPPSSHTELCVSGLEVHVYGLKETLNSKTLLADVIFTLPGRQGTYQSIERFAQEILAKDKGSAPAGTAGRGFVVVSFDQRNHGHRNVSDRANDS